MGGAGDDRLSRARHPGREPIGDREEVGEVLVADDERRGADLAEPPATAT